MFEDSSKHLSKYLLNISQNNPPNIRQVTLTKSMKLASLLLDIDGTNENYFDFVLENKLTYVVLLNNTLTANVRL